MIEEEGFISRILANPANWPIYHIFADWLEEQDIPVAHYLRFVQGNPLVRKSFDGISCAWRRQGLQMRFTKKKLLCVMLHGQHGKFREYAGDLPAGLSFTDSPASTRDKLGPPTLHASNWDMYENLGFTVFYKFTKRQTLIEHVTITRCNR
ncbi:MAG: hypothetical protein ACFCD0_24745 [Gemmataceae bacterium]